MNFGGEKGTHVRLLITDLTKCVNFVAVSGKSIVVRMPRRQKSPVMIFSSE